jgi:hypothetical protein
LKKFHSVLLNAPQIAQKTTMCLSVVRFRRPGLKIRWGRWELPLCFHTASYLAHVGSCFLWGKAMGGLSWPLTSSRFEIQEFVKPYHQQPRKFSWYGDGLVHVESLVQALYNCSMNYFSTAASVHKLWIHITLRAVKTSEISCTYLLFVLLFYDDLCTAQLIQCRIKAGYK